LLAEELLSGLSNVSETVSDDVFCAEFGRSPPRLGCIATIRQKPVANLATLFKVENNEPGPADQRTHFVETTCNKVSRIRRFAL
jgi:hypothetical protein